jgi:hypothetical protein
MLKKTAVALMLLAMALSLLGGCFRMPKEVSDIIQEAQNAYENDSDDSEDEDEDDDSDDADDTDVRPSDDADDGDDEDGTGGSLTPASNPSEGYNNYITVKGEAIDRVMGVSEQADALTFTVSMSLMGVSMADLSLLAITAFSDDLQASEMALGWMGFEDIEIKGSGNDYTITYTDSEGKSVEQTCRYDPKTDSLESAVYNEDGTVAMFFEYVRQGDAYVAQYFYPWDESYQIIRAYFDTDNIAAFGTCMAFEQPDSIIGQTGLDEGFVENEESYLILKDGKLTVFDNGTTTTN